MRVRKTTSSILRWKLSIFGAGALVALCCSTAPALAQRVLGIDISYWNRGSSSATSNGITQANFNTAYSTPDVNGHTRQFAYIRATRGGSTGLDQSSGTYGNPPSIITGAQRYDDPDFMRNINRATTAGMLAGPYHFGRPDVAGNSGTDEANHFIQMAGPWMRPGYMMPIYDMEAGQAETTPDQLAQFVIDFSNRIYSVMQIRPGMYINGNYSGDLQGASASLRNQIAQPVANTPSVIGPAYPMLWNARYSDNANPNAIPVQTGSPKTTYTTISSYYGPWDDYGNSTPWAFWQYASTIAVPGIADGTLDGNVAHGDIEYVRDFLVPAVWWNDSSGDWSTLANWNSGQPTAIPVTPADQSQPFNPGGVPTPRLPGAAGSGPTSGQYDTVILERPSSNITVTISTGSHNVRKLYMRETLNMTGGSLTINYDPLYNFNVSVTDSLRSGALSAQFSGAVTVSGNAALTVTAVQVDASKTFTLAGGTLTFNKINLMSSAKLLMSGDVTINPLNSSNPRYTSHTAIISGATGNVDLGGAIRILTVGNVTDDVDLDIAVPIINGGLTKNGAGTMRLSGNNTFASDVTVNSGVLRYNHSSGLTTTTAVTVNNGGTLDMNNITDTIASLASAAGQTTGVVSQGTAALTLVAPAGTNTFEGTITGTGAFTKSGAATQILSGNNILGTVSISAGALLFNGTNTTGNVTISGGVLGGTGSVTGAVTVNSGAHLAPGASIESLGVGALTLNAGSILDFELGAPGTSDLVDVNGLLTLSGGAFNFVNAGGLSIGFYNLIDYGTVSGSLGALSVPTAPGNLNYNLVDTGSVIGLQVSLLGDFNNDGMIGNADYVVWRKGLGTTYTPADYDVWRAHYGETPSAGPGTGAGGAIPEPTSVALLLIGWLPLCCRRRVRR
jgi:autotransporter-associated beta strand protein